MFKEIKKAAFIYLCITFSEASASLVSNILPSPQTQNISWICKQSKKTLRYSMITDVVGKREKDSKVFTGGDPMSPYHDYKQYPIEINERISLSASQLTDEYRNLPPSQEIHYIWQINKLALLNNKSTAFSVNLHHGNKLETSIKYPGRYTVNVVAFVRNKNDKFLNYKSYKNNLNCTFHSLPIHITANPELIHEPKIKFEGWTQYDLEKFFHLDLVNAPKARELVDKIPSKLITVAVIGTGVDYNHPFLRGYITNHSCSSLNLPETSGQCEIPNNKIDDDKNGYIDDVHGWDFENNDNKPFDDDGHETHVAGLIGSIAGVAYGKVKILPIKYDVGRNYIAKLAESIKYAVNRGVDIINISSGQTNLRASVNDIPLLKSAIEYSEKKNVVVVIAAGNDGPKQCINYFKAPSGIIKRKSTCKYYSVPGKFGKDYKNIFTVAATDLMGNITRYSSFSQEHIALAAPGGDGQICTYLMSDDECKKALDKAKENADYQKTVNQTKLLSLMLMNANNELFQRMDGTSVAAPLVSGIIATALSVSPDNNILYKNERVDMDILREVLLNSGQVKEHLKTRVMSGRIIDAYDVVRKVIK